MRALTTCTLAALLATGCVKSPEVTRVSLDASPEDAFTCAMRQVSESAFHVDEVDRESGFLIAEKRRSGSGPGPRWSVVRVTVVSGAEEGARMNVSAESRGGGSSVLGRMKAGKGSPTDESRQVAARIVEVCGD